MAPREVRQQSVAQRLFEVSLVDVVKDFCSHHLKQRMSYSQIVFEVS